jgi:hypothetical protein
MLLRSIAISEGLSKELYGEAVKLKDLVLSVVPKISFSILSL